MENVCCDEHYDLLIKTQSTCEGILASGRSDIWSTYGALRRATAVFCDILLQGLAVEDEEELLKYLLDNNPKHFVKETSLSFDSSVATSLEQFIEEECLLSYSASLVIENCFLDGDRKQISKLYRENAFVRSRPCLLCLKICFAALEQNSLDLLTSLKNTCATKEQFFQYIKEERGFDPIILDHKDEKTLTSSVNTSSVPSYSYSISSGDEIGSDAQDSILEIFGSPPENAIQSDGFTGKVFRQDVSKRRSLHQDVLMTSALAAVMETNEDGVVWFDDTDRKSLVAEPVDKARQRIARMREISRSESSLFNEHGHIETEGNRLFEDRNTNEAVLQSDSKASVTAKTPNASKTDELTDDITPVLLRRSSNVVTTPFKRGHNRSKSDQIGVLKTVDASDTEDGKREEVLLPNSAPEESRHEGYYYQHEDGRLFPKPYKGQSLISYLDSRIYDTGAELDKENAHFSICEALITAIEQMRCSKQFDSESDESDEEIRALKRKIKEKKLRKRMSKIETQNAFSERSTSSNSRSTSSFFSDSTFSSSYSSSATDETIPKDATSQKTLSRSWDNVSLSPNQSKTNVNTESTNNPKPAAHTIEETAPEPKPDDYSAEVVAKLLLKKFVGRKLPAASELKWIVSEVQVPQNILPLPNAWPVSPDDAQPNGWGMSGEDANNIKNFRKASMPTRIRGNLEWAPPRPQIIFTSHPYMKRKSALQKQHYRCAGCGLKVTPSLSKRFRYCHYLGKYFCTSCHQNRTQLIPSKIITKWDFKQYPYHELRLKLHYANGFLKTCRLGESLHENFRKLPAHIVDDIHLYSVDDFVQVKNGDLLNTFKSLISTSLKHIKECQLCAVKGFVCEYCRDFDDILYPFELNKVTSCPSSDYSTRNRPNIYDNFY
eukprot:gene16901-8385_t